MSRSLDPYQDPMSPDRTVTYVLPVHDEAPTVAAFHRALVTATGADAVIVMDTDLQDPPRVSMELVRRWA